jgi:hypothetical protein
MACLQSLCFSVKKGLLNNTSSSASTGLVSRLILDPDTSKPNTMAPTNLEPLQFLPRRLLQAPTTVTQQPTALSSILSPNSLRSCFTDYTSSWSNECAQYQRRQSSCVASASSYVASATSSWGRHYGRMLILALFLVLLRKHNTKARWPLRSYK